MKIDAMMSEGADALYRASAADLSLNDNRAAWLAERCGKLTASNMAKAMSFNKNGQPAKERTDLMVALIGERLTSMTTRNFVSDAMEFGLETEPEAKDAYMQKTGSIIRPSGFYDHPSIDMCGATPDGELAPDGLIEIKCPTTPTYIKWRMSGVVPDEHKPQMCLQIACTGRKWIEFVAYDPRIKDEDKRLFIRRYHPTIEEVEAVELAAMTFLSELDKLWEAFHS